MSCYIVRYIIILLLLIPSLSWGLGENIKNNKNAIKGKIQDKVEVARSNNNNSSVSSANKELIHQFKNNFTTIEDLEDQYGLTANNLPSYINTISINQKELKVKKYIGIGPNDFINLYNCEFLSKTNTQDIS